MNDYLYFRLSKRVVYGLVCIGIGGALASVNVSFADNLRSTQTVVGSELIVPYDGYLMVDSSPITGTREIKFELFEAASGGTVEWTETQTVNLYNGRFSVGLGTSTVLTDTLLDAEKLWLAMTIIDTNASGTAVEIPLSGRQAIEPAPFAAWAANSADMQVSGSLDVDGSANVAGSLDVGSQVSVGTTSQQARLDVEGLTGGTVTLKAGQLTVDSEDGQGLINLVAGAIDDGGYKYLGTRGASRIRMNDAYLGFFTGSLASNGGQAAGDSVTFTEGLAIDSAADTFVRNDLEVDGATTLVGNLSTQGDVTLGNGTADDTTISGALTVTEDITMANDRDLLNTDLIQGYNDLRFRGSSASSSDDLRIETDGTVNMSGDLNVTGDVDITGDLNTFPAGSYCIISGDQSGSCPTGFTAGRARFDTEDSNNNDSFDGSTGGLYDAGSGGRIDLRVCCK